MTRRVPIQLNVGNALQWLGNLYRNPADAIKEHISNAIDEHLKAQNEGRVAPYCDVVFLLEKRAVTIDYPYGMDRHEFEAALRRVADSIKKRSDICQIGRLGIGMFSFQQIGKKCTFFSKKDVAGETIRVILIEGSDEAEIDSARKCEALDTPGIRIRITELKLDPTKSRGPLSADKLQQTFAEKFDEHLRRGWLRITIRCGQDVRTVAPLQIDLPRLADGLHILRLPDDPRKTVGLNLYFDPSGKGIVGIRHMGVVVVEDIKTLSAYGLEESVYAGGYVKGFIDADFLEPLPARTGFEEGSDWVNFLDLLLKQEPQIQAEVEIAQQKEREKTFAEIQRAAIRLAKEIFDLEEFRDLELLGGTTRTKSPVQTQRSAPTGQRTGERSTEPGNRSHPGGPRINYAERPFETGAARHSRFVGGEVQVNTLNADYKKEMAGPDEAKLAYATLMIGKETIAYNDKSASADEHLERLLSFYFRLKDRIAPKSPVPGKRMRGRPRKLL